MISICNSYSAKMAADVTDRDKTARHAAASVKTTTKVPVPFVVVFDLLTYIMTTMSDRATHKAASQLQ